MTIPTQRISETLNELSVPTEGEGWFWQGETIDSWMAYGKLTAVQDLLSQGAVTVPQIIERYLAEAQEVLDRKADRT